jgi:hypothetical protein
LVGQGLDRWQDWSLAGVLYRLEAYNGFGYRKHHPEVRTPYLWSFSQHYGAGKYVQDGVWSPTAVSQQCGAAVLLRGLVDRKQVGAFEAAAKSGTTPVEFERVEPSATVEAPPSVPLPPAVAPPIAPQVAPAAVVPARKSVVLEPTFRAGARIRFYAGGPPKEDARRLQAFLNEVGGFRLVLDGKAGRHTSNATRSVLGHYLLGDPRA